MELDGWRGGSCDDDNGGMVVGWLGVGGYDGDSSGMVFSGGLGGVSCDDNNGGMVVGWLGVGGYDGDSSGMVFSGGLGGGDGVGMSGSCNSNNNGVVVELGYGATER
ncbi:loricrin-like [Cynara cardunculus var. scolymus]|uniref:loricrin-like n=1 Tax=Cynara cardunculus var. scolymus TaxID=59895 RepID=UPI000D62B323|nr:loricrin-like [Cynara cardunculus var. scolymus]